MKIRTVLIQGVAAAAIIAAGALPAAAAKCVKAGGQGTGITPVRWTLPETGKVWLCGCKHTGKPPLCDGSHNNL